MFAEAFESVKRRYFDSGRVARPREAADGTDDHVRTEESTDADSDLQPFVLTPGEEVLQLLRRNSGRLNQGELVEALDWSPATVSRRLGEMEADGQLVRYQIGRRKIVCLPDCQPAAARSPFEA